MVQVANASMAGAIRSVSIEVGEDPRQAALIAYGGAGPLFASLLARELGIRTIVIPNYAGNFSAWGLLEQDVVRSAALTIVVPLGDEGIARAEQTLAQLFGKLEARIERERQGSIFREAEFDLRYPGQEYTMTVPVALATDASPSRRIRSRPGSPRPTSGTTATASMSGSTSWRCERSSGQCSRNLRSPAGARNGAGAARRRTRLLVRA